MYSLFVQNNLQINQKTRIPIALAMLSILISSAWVHAQVRPLAEIIPSSAPYAFGHEPAHQADDVKNTHFSLMQLSSAWQDLRRMGDEKAPSWNEDERAFWNDLKNFPVPKTQEEWEALGIKDLPPFWLFGLGLTPMLVVDLKRPELIDQWLSQYSADWSKQFEMRPHPQGSYWRLGLKRWTLLARRQESRFYIALIPMSAEPVLLSHFLKNRRASNLSELLRDRFAGLPKDSRGSGIIQIDQLIDLLFGSDKPLLKHSGMGLGLPSPLFKPCEIDFRALAHTWKSVTIGLKQVDQTIQLLSLINLDPSATQVISSLQLNSSLLTPFEDPSALEFALRFNFGQVFKWLETLEAGWRDHPWTCPFLTRFNGLTPLINHPSRFQIQLLLSPLTSLTFRGKREARGDQQSESQKSLTGWLELSHLTPQLLLQLLNQTGHIKLSQEQMQPQEEMIDLSPLNSHLQQFNMTHRPHQLMFSLGQWGSAHHDQQRGLTQRIESAEITAPSMSLNRPMIQLSLPEGFQQMIRDRIDSFSGKTSTSTTENDDVSKHLSREQLSKISLHAHPLGLLLITTMKVNSL